MDIATVFGIVGGFGLIMGAILLGGGLDAFIDVPSIVVTFGGTFTVLFTMFPMKVITGAVKVAMKAFFSKPPDMNQSIRQIISLAETARKESLVALEKASVPDPFLARGILLVADGTAESLVRGVMETEINYMKKRHTQGQNFFKAMGTYGPAFGMIGTLIGLIQMLARLDDPKSIGPAMATAIITTFYGALLANLLFVPISGKLKARTLQEEVHLFIIFEGAKSILQNNNPRLVYEKLSSFIHPKERRPSKE